MRIDEDQLVQALHSGMFETPLWADFLARLKARSGMRAVCLVLRAPDSGALFPLGAGEDWTGLVQQLFASPNGPGQLPYMSMRDGRAYALEELLEPAAALRIPGIAAGRLVRVGEQGGTEAWLGCFGDRGIGTPATGALLTALVPHLRIALRSFASLERERFRSAMSGQAIARLSLGWMTLDARCRILETTDTVEELFQWGELLRRGRYERLVPASPAIDRQLTALVKGYADGTESRSRAFTLSQDPWFDMLVAPLHDLPVTGGPRAATAIVYVSGDRKSQADRYEQLAELFGLLPSEARLAWMMGQSTSIAEAAERLGLTIETARNYSKKIYAKTGARGHAELVRIVMTSVLALG
ncbi:MAG: helix-turn-helix transcriptional regulator [Erythrobacter sp.]